MAGDGTTPPTVNTTGGLIVPGGRFTIDNLGNFKALNPTLATASVSQSSPIFTLSGQYWNGSASAEDTWTLQNICQNGTNVGSRFAIGHTGSTGGSGTSPAIQYGNFLFETGATRSYANSNYASIVANSIVLFGSGSHIGITNQGGAEPIVFDGNKLTKYNNEATAALGVEYLRGATTQKAETGADATLLSVTPAAAAGTYRLTIALNVSAASSATLGWTATWTDSNGTAQAPTNLALSKSGTAAAALTFTAAANDNYYGEWLIDINNAGTAIVIKTTFAGTSIAYKASAYIERVA
jgi:hypothetical protein